MVLEEGSPVCLEQQLIVHGHEKRQAAEHKTHSNCGHPGEILILRSSVKTEGARHHYVLPSLLIMMSTPTGGMLRRRRQWKGARRRRKWLDVLCAALLLISHALPVVGFLRILPHHRKAVPQRISTSLAARSQRKWNKPTTTTTTSRKTATRPKSSPSLTSELKSMLRSRDNNPKVPVEAVEKMLLERVEEADVISFNLVLSAYARQRTWVAARRADHLLRILLKNSRLGDCADTYSYSAVLTAYARSGGRRQAALRAQELLRQMQVSSGIRIDTDICHNAVMNCWSVSGDTDAGRRAGVLLTQLEDNQRKGQYPRATRFSYNSCLKALARSNGAAEARRLLDRMKSLDESLQPDKISFATTIDAYCRSAASNLTLSVAEVESMLIEMETSCDSNPSVRPDIVVYTAVLSLFAKADVDTDRAMALVQRMKVYAREEPNTPFLNTLIHLFAKRGKASQAYALLESMKAKDMADKFSYTSAISAMANVGNATAAMKLFDELNACYESTKKSSDRFLPTERTFCSVFFSLANSKDRKNIPISQVDRLLDRMHLLYDETCHPELVPTTAIYSTIFLFLSKVKDPSAPTKATELLEEMKAQVAQGNQLARPNAAIFVYVINFYTKFRIREAAHMATKLLEEVERGYASGDDSLRPTKLLYSAVLQAYAKSASKEGADASERLLERCQGQYESGKVYAKPTVLFYNAFMDALARSGQGKVASLKCESLLKDLERRSIAGDVELQPTTRTFNAAILAWRESNSTEAPQRAEALLKRMNERYKVVDSDCQPDEVTINLMIGVWGKSGQPQRAEKYLELFFEGDDQFFDASPFAYNTVIDAYSRSSDANAAWRAETVFQRMRDRYRAGEKELRPDMITLTSLLKAWSGSDAEQSAEKVQEIQNLIGLERSKRM